MKHASAPWIHIHNLRPDKAPIDQIVDKVGNVVVHWAGFDESWFPPAVREANARLIAYAPLLLHELQLQVVNCRACNGFGYLGFGFSGTEVPACQICLPARNLIKKAMGRP